MINPNSIDKVGVKCRLVHNICKVKLPLRKNISEGVEITDTVKGRDKINNLDILCESFTTISGKSVAINKLRRGVTYTLIENVNIPCKAVVLPNNRNINIFGKNYNGGKVVVLIDGHITVISPQLFKRMFIIDETLDEFQKRTRNADKGSRRIKTKEKSIQEKVASIMKDNIDGTGVDTKAKENKNVGKVKLVMRIVDINGVVIGFAVIDNDGRKLKLSYNKIMQMTRNGLVENAKIEKSGGKEILKGYAMNIDNLPKVYK